MSSPARKLARQNKKNSAEGKEEQKNAKTEKQSMLPLTPRSISPTGTGHQPKMQIRQRRSGNS
jgi:hypothetical protein